MPESVKVATFSSEILRRLKTTSILSSKEETAEVLTTFMEDMKVMGYKEDWRKKVLKSALVGYMRILGKVEKGESERNGKGTVTLRSRRLKKLVGVREWHRVDDKPDMEPWKREGEKPGRR